MPENEETATTSQAGEKPRRGRPRKAEGTKRRTRRTAKKTTARAQKPRTQKSNLLFALDIGTRSVIGIAATKEKDGTIAILATERQEHATRAMLDGQIHDVPQVAAVIRGVKEKLEGDVGPLKSAAVAAAGRALYTMTATAEKQIAGVIRAEDERDLDFAGVQAAQAKLAASHTVDDPTHYYCVGYSTIRYELDGSQLKSLVGQRGDVARAEVIATFLPRQVIDSMQSALEATGLSMQALTLEPIAAINVLSAQARAISPSRRTAPSSPTAWCRRQAMRSPRPSARISCSISMWRSTSNGRRQTARGCISAISSARATICLRRMS